MSSIVFEPALWYAVTARDVTEGCVNYGQEFEVNPCYSNGGTVIIECGRCHQLMEIVAATLLNPQPEVS
ncbi:hypothetical protein ACFZDK_24610 [Streptomyces sp. NPDC007901]|uniref:hypothetical protein n=1 Tax=Streptomyces sp. NPDC007901 TaxID=3364785 RepID=UPI0036E903D4